MAARAVGEPPDPDAEWWTTSDVAAYTGTAISTISSYRMRGQMIEPDQKVGRTWLWKPQRVMAWRPGGRVRQ